MTEDMEAFTGWGGTQWDNGQCIPWNTQRIDMTHESGSTRRQDEYPIDWMKCRQVPCSKVTTKFHFICKMN